MSNSAEAMRLLSERLGSFDNIKPLLDVDYNVTPDAVRAELMEIACALKAGAIGEASTTTETALSKQKIATPRVTA